MSEEILKALMQLFAIISKQDDGFSSQQKDFVNSFLLAQLNPDRVLEFITLYEQFLLEGAEKEKKERKVEKTEEKEGGEPKEKEKDKDAKRTSMKDSVRILSICKKINKTLSQKQKGIVLIRLYEIANLDRNPTPLRLQIINTAAEVFNIELEEISLIENFVFKNLSENTESTQNKILIGPHVDGNKNTILAEGIDGQVNIIRLNSVNLLFLCYTGTSNLFLNGLIIKPNTIYNFAPGSTIRMPRGTVYYSDVISRMSADENKDPLTFNAEINAHYHPNGKRALHTLHISEKGGTLVGLMGGSGAGKTTLLNVLAGLDTLSEGSIRINSLDLHKDKKQLEGVIGYIPQDDLLMDDLSVYENLYYNAKLCFKDLNEKEIEERVLKVLSMLGLKEIKDIKVGNPLNKKISGGQRKRLNIALELIREPMVLYVDEPTSGLSSRDSENVMDLLKEISQKGKLIFVVIHQPSSDIYKMFDRLIILDVGGFPIYYGNPIEAVMYFKRETNQLNPDEGECHSCGNVNPELVFSLIESKEVDEYGNFTQSRKFNPKKWNEIFSAKIVRKKVEDIAAKINNVLTIPNKLKQIQIFIARDVLSKVSNQQYVMLTLLMAPMLALILSSIIVYIDHSAGPHYIFRTNENVPAYIFMCIVVSLFLGLTLSAEEIFKDLKILRREKFLNLSRLSYLLSKIVILFVISAIQSLLFCIIGNSTVAIKGMFFDVWFVLFSVSCLANTMGLVLSSTFNSAVTIYILIPLIIIPQMILGGAMFSFEKLNGKIGGGHGDQVPVLADFMVSRWAYEGLMVNQFINNKYEKNLYPFDKLESNFNYKLAYYIPKVDELLETYESKESTAEEKHESYTVALSELKKECNALGLKEELAGISSLNEKEMEKNLPLFDAAIKAIKSKYTDMFNQVSDKRLAYMTKIESDPVKVKELQESKDSYYNDHLTDIVKNTFTKEKIKIRDGELVQNVDPVFFVPEKNSNPLNYRYHFFAPVKYFFSAPMPTYWFNTMVLWIMNIIGFVVLYFNLVSKGFVLAEKLTGPIGQFFSKAVEKIKSALKRKKPEATDADKSQTTPTPTPEQQTKAPAEVKPVEKPVVS